MTQRSLPLLEGGLRLPPHQPSLSWPRFTVSHTHSHIAKLRERSVKWDIEDLKYHNGNIFHYKYGGKERIGAVLFQFRFPVWCLLTFILLSLISVSYNDCVLTQRTMLLFLIGGQDRTTEERPELWRVRTSYNNIDSANVVGYFLAVRKIAVENLLTQWLNVSTRDCSQGMFLLGSSSSRVYMETFV